MRSQDYLIKEENYDILKTIKERKEVMEKKFAA